MCYIPIEFDVYSSPKKETQLQECVFCKKLDNDFLCEDCKNRFEKMVAKT